MIALEMSLLMKNLCLDRICHFILGACLSRTSVQIIGNASNSFSFRNLPCISSSSLHDSKKVSL